MEQRSGTRSHFTRLHGQKESAMCHVPTGMRVPTAAGKHREQLHRLTVTHTDRKPFDINLLVFRGKSQRNFLFYTRRKNYFHIRLTSFCSGTAEQPPEQSPVPVPVPRGLAQSLSVLNWAESSGARRLRYSPCPVRWGAGPRSSRLMLMLAR